MIMKRTTNDKSAKLKVYSRVQSIGLALCMLVAGIVAVPSAYASGSRNSGQEESGTKEGKMPLADSLKATADSTAIAVSNGSHQQAANGSDTAKRNEVRQWIDSICSLACGTAVQCRIEPGKG